VQRWLTGAGLEATAVSENRLLIQAHGTAEQVERAFGTRLGMYRVGEQLLRAPSSALSVPAAVAPLVAAATGLGEVDRGAIPTSGLATAAPVPPPPGSRSTASPPAPAWSTSVPAATKTATSWWR